MVTEELLAKLEAWREADADFHRDRQLADEVLIADGWQCEPDTSFEGGIRWFWGTAPQVSTSESSRPHPLIDMNAAVGVVPFRANWRIMRIGGLIRADAWFSQPLFSGESQSTCIAIVIAALKLKRSLDK